MTPEGRASDDEDGRPEWVRHGSDYHVPVLIREVVEGLLGDRSGVYVDATLGGGGHAEAMLETLDPGATVVGIDADEASLEAVRSRLEVEVAEGRLRLVHGNFRRLEQLLAEDGLEEVDGVLFDLGVSSRQVDRSERGFSYREEGPLDMRMDRTRGTTASQVVNRWGEDELVRLLRDYGEEPRARSIARAIVRARPVETTGELAVVVRSAVPEPEEVKSLSRVFQAIRIEVNEELAVLEEGLEAATRVVRPSGRAAVVSYHSLEDRRVKRYFKYGNFEGRPRRDLYGHLVRPWRPVTDGVIRPADDEVEANPRARSARLRIAERRDESGDRRPLPW